MTKKNRGFKVLAAVWALMTLLLLRHSAFAESTKPVEPSSPADSTGDLAPPEVPASPAPLSETLTGLAKEHYDAAVLLFQDGDAAGALLKFRAAHELSNDSRLLWNMAACEKQQRHYAKMLPLLEQYLEQGGALVSDTERVEANTVIATLQPFVAIVQINSNEEGAQVFIDDELVGTTPLGPQRVDMGTRRFSLKKGGFVDWTSNEQIEGGTGRTLVATLEAIRHVGTLRITTDGNAAIRVDGKLVGHGRWRGELPSGIHSVEVRSPGMQVYQGDAAVLDGQISALRVALKPVARPPESAVPAWLWITGGALLTAGIGVGAYAVLSPDDPRPAPIIAGTMQPGAIEMP